MLVIITTGPSNPYSTCSVAVERCLDKGCGVSRMERPVMVVPYTLQCQLKAEWYRICLGEGKVSTS